MALLEKVEKLARAKDPRIVQVMAGLAGEYDVVLVARADGTLAADVRPLVRLSVTVIAEQTVEGQVRREVGTGGGGGRFGFGYFHDTVIESYVDQAVTAALTNLESRPAPARSMFPTAASPYLPAMYAHSAWPYRYGKYFGLSRSSTFGSFSRRAASRIHIAVSGSTGPSDRYSAIPSMNHPGSMKAFCFARFAMSI